MAELVGWDALQNGGFAYTVWPTLTGKTASHIFPASTSTNDDLASQIANALGSGKRMTLGTKSNIDTAVINNIIQEYATVFGKTVSQILGNHEYVITAIKTEPNGEVYVHLFNPWGNEHFNMNVDYLVEIVKDFSILTQL